MNLLSYLLGRCLHRHVGFPIRNRQRCLDCGRARDYYGLGKRAGNLRMGPWHVDNEAASGRQRVFVLESEGE